MRIDCPVCGARDRREFSVKGAWLHRPEGVDWSQAWDAYLHLRDNPAGPTRELWYHGGGCGAWLVFLWAVRKGEFEDVEEPKYRMLEDDDLPVSQSGPAKSLGDTAEKQSLRAEDQAKQSR